MPETTIFSIGHSNKPLEALIELLQQFNIDTLIDVRTSPGSRWHPQFNTHPIQEACDAADMRYELRGKNVGGLGRNVDFDETIDEFFERAQNGEQIALMCSEGKPDDCHRKSMLAPEFLKRRMTMTHILWNGTSIVQTEPDQRIEKPPVHTKPPKPPKPVGPEQATLLDVEPLKPPHNPKWAH